MNCEKLIHIRRNAEDLMLIDIRETYEYEELNIGGIHIPMGDVLNRLDEIPKDKPVVIHCQSGARGQKLTQVLHHMGYHNVSNLEGGLERYLELMKELA
jgi:rhodanese-related sulfurtransferase